MKDNSLLILGDVIGKNIFWIIVPLGTIGNLLIIAYFLKINFPTTLRRMSLYHYLIIQLAIVDLVTSITTPATINEFHEPTWNLENFWCTIGYPLFMAIPPYASCWVLVLISYERYRSITRPFAKRGTKCKYSIVVFMILVVIMVSVIPFTRTKFTVVENSNNRDNHNTNSDSNNNNTTNVTSNKNTNNTNYNISNTNSTIIYSSMINIDTSHDKSSSNSTNSTYDNNTTTKTNKNYRCIEGKEKFTPTNYIFYALSRRALDCFIPASLMYLFYCRIRNWMNQEVNNLPLTDESKKRNRVALRTLRNLIIVYIACVFPGRIVVAGIHIDDNYQTEGRRDYFNLVHELFSLVSLFNNVVNVFVYAAMIKDFRKFILSIFTFGLGCFKEILSA